MTIALWCALGACLLFGFGSLIGRVLRQAGRHNHLDLRAAEGREDKSFLEWEGNFKWEDGRQF